MGCNGVSCCCKEKLILNEKLETCDKGGGRSLDELEFYLRFCFNFLMIILYLVQWWLQEFFYRESMRNLN